MMTDRDQVIRDLAQVINRHSLENDSNTPDFLLAEYMLAALETFTDTSNRRESWYGKKLEIKYEHKNTHLYTQAEWDKKYGIEKVENND